MAISLDTSAEIAKSNANPVTKSYTCGANSSLIVVTLSYQNGSSGRSGTLTYDGVNMTQVDATRNTSGECATEMWYLTGMTTGSAANVSIPNPNGCSIWGYVSSYKCATGYIIKYYTSTGSSGTAANPEATVNVRAYGVGIASLGDGYAYIPSAYSHTPLGACDFGQYITAVQYGIDSGSGGDMTLKFTISSDDYGIVAASFEESAVKTVNEISFATVSNKINGLAPSSINFVNGLKL